jgi:peptide/nickel transport system substrate-binding protein
MSKIRTALIVTLVMMLGISGMLGCAPKQAVVTTEEVAAPTEEVAAPTEEVAATSEAAAEEAKTLRVAVTYALDAQLDPIANIGSVAQRIVGPIFESLIGLGPDGQLVPLLATSWEPNEDSTIWTIHLREGVQFHDGWGEMTSEDVKFSIERFASPEAVSARSTMLQEYIKDIVAVDKYTVEIDLLKPNPEFVEFLFRDGPINSDGMVMSKAYFDAVGVDGFLYHPIGTGVWKFSAYEYANFISFDAVDEHWSGKLPEFDHLIIMEVPEEGARIAMLRNGDADLIDVSIDSAVSMKNEGWNVLVVPEIGASSLRFIGNWRPEAIEANMPTSHVEVREALSLAINRQEIVDNMFGGLFDPVPLPGLGTAKVWLGIDNSQWVEWAKTADRYDPERAKELLAEAGFPDGFEITVWSTTSSRGPWQPELIEVIAGYWEQIGVRTNIVSSDWEGYVRPAVQTDPQPDEFIGTVTILTSGVDVYAAQRMGDSYGPVSSHRLLNPTNEEWMNLASSLQTETDLVLREKNLNELVKIISEQWVDIILFYPSEAYIVSDKVSAWNVIPGLPIPTLWIDSFTAAK